MAKNWWEDAPLVEQPAAAGPISGLTREQKQMLALRSDYFPTPEPEPYSAARETSPFKAFAIGAGKAYDAINTGLQQADWWMKKKSYGALGATNAERAYGDLLDAQRERYEGDLAEYKKLQEEHPIATGFGEMVPAMAIPISRGATAGQVIRNNAVAGAVPGLLGYGTLGERAATGAIGGIASGATAGALKGIGALKEVFSTHTQGGREKLAQRVVGEVAGDKADEIVRALENYRPGLPGEVMTGAGASRSSRLAALERTVRNLPGEGSRFVEEIDVPNNAARWAAVNSIAGTPEDYAASKAAREAAALPLLAEAKANARTPITKPIFDLLESQAKQVKNNPTKAAAIKQAMNGLSGAKSVEDLIEYRHWLDLSISGKLAGEEKNAMHAASQLMGVKAAVDEALGKATGGKFQEYLAAWSAKSKPLNRMDVGRQIADRFATSQADSALLPSMTTVAYKRVARDAVDDGWRNALTPDDLKMLEAVGSNLDALSHVQSAGRAAGSNTAQNLLADKALGEGLLGRLGYLEGTGVGHMLQLASSNAMSKAKQKTMEEVGRILRDPELTAKAIRTAKPSQAQLLARQYIPTLGSPTRQLGLLSYPAAMGFLQGSGQGE